MSLSYINEKLRKAWENEVGIGSENIPEILTLDFMGSRYYTFDDKDENLFEFYSFDITSKSIAPKIYKANRNKCMIMQEEDSEEEYYFLEGANNLVVITSKNETSQIMLNVLAEFRNLTK